MPAGLNPRVAVACIYHESNSFTPVKTGWAAFDPWLVGDEIVALRGTQTVTGGFLDGCADRGIDPIPTLYAWATPSGVVEHDVFVEIEHALYNALSAAGPVDALLLELHGGMVVDGIDRPDTRLASTARRAVGAEAVVAVVMDPHANVHPELAEHADIALAYQLNPHVDMHARGMQAVECLVRALEESRRPSTVVVQVPIVAPPIGQATAEAPLAELTGLAREAESLDSNLLAASILFGYAYADVPELGMSVAVCHFDPRVAAEVAERLAEACWAARDGFARHLEDPGTALDLAADEERLVVIADTGDNIGGGSSGASTVLLSEALQRPAVAVATTLCDREAVAAARSVGVGGEVRVVAGEPPIELNGVVTWVGSGRYRNKGPLSAGVEFDMGEVAIVQIGRSTCLLCSQAVMANDQNMLRAFGIDPAQYDAVILKGAAAIRAGWADMGPRFIDAATVGETPNDLATLPYRRRRSLYPLEAIEVRHAE